MQRPAPLAIAALTLLACASGSADPGARSSQVAPLIEFRLAHDEPAASRERVECEGETLYLERHAVISDPDFRAVRPSVRPDHLFLDMRLRPDGARRLEQVTREHVGRRMALRLDSRVCSASVIRSAVGPRLQAAVDLPEGEAERIARRIRARWPNGEGDTE